jgi:L,D-transpeptidase catalytic domain/Putative peptidoglycan binding domain
MPKYDLPVRTALRLLAPIAALVAALSFAPAAAAAPAPTKLSLSGPSKAPGGTTTFTAKLTANGQPLAGKSVSLFAGQPSPLATGATDGAGRVAFEVTVTAPTRFQASYDPAPADAAAYAPAKSKMLTVAPSSGTRLSILSYLHSRHRAVGVPHTKVLVRGAIATSTPAITIDVFNGSKRLHHRSIGVKRAGAGGTFSFYFKPGGRGVYRIRAMDAGGTTSKRLYVVRPSASAGASGTAVRALQSRLHQLGYLVPISGRFDGSTGRAVLAFRKVNGFARTMSASSAVFKKLARGGGGFHVRYPSAGKHAEFDWSRQVLALVRGAKPVMVLHASSGKPSTPTVFGRFHFYSKTPGYNAHGMYYSNYFVGGYAIHGYDPVPDYAASHGCIRIPIPSAKRVYRWIDLGDTMYVYR